MWGCDSTPIPTVDDGELHLFTAVEHWNSECVGWTVARTPNLDSAVETVASAIRTVYGSVQPFVASGLTLRLDHSPIFLSHDYQQRLATWGIDASFSFPMQPQNNGVAERFNRTVKEQVMGDGPLRNEAQVTRAIGGFIANHTKGWLVAKLGYQTPAEAREQWEEMQCRTKQKT